MHYLWVQKQVMGTHVQKWLRASQSSSRSWSKQGMLAMQLKLSQHACASVPQMSIRCCPQLRPCPAVAAFAALAQARSLQLDLQLAERCCILMMCRNTD